MAKLHNQKTGELISEINDAQLQFLIAQLEEEDSTDKDYYINRDTLAMMRAADGDPALMKLLEDAMGASGEVDIVWK